MSVGKVGTFDIEKDSWDSYVERLEQYFIANDVKVQIRVATLITVIGSEAYELMVNLCTPDRPATKSFEALVNIMKEHLQPKPSLLAERFKFRQRRQLKSECVAEYAAELKKMSKTCGFNLQSLAENLRDQFVCGLFSDIVRQRLFAEDDITFDKAFKLAVTMEAAETDAALVDNHVVGPSSPSSTTIYQSTEVHKQRQPIQNRHGGNRRIADLTRASQVMGGARGGGGGASNGGSARALARDVGRGADLYRSSPNTAERPHYYNSCKVCGGKHDSSICKFKHYVCRVCNKDGHLKKMCPRVRNIVPNTTTLYNNNYVEDMTDSDNHEGSDEVFEYNSSEVDLNRYKPICMDLFIDNVRLSMEVDSGSAMSCINELCYEKYFSHHKLEDCRYSIYYYTGEIVKPVGKIQPLVRYKNNCKRLDLYIMRNGRESNLLGRYWLYELGINIPSLNCNHMCANKVFNLDYFSSRFSEVFGDGLGCFTGGTVGFHLRPDARPIFMRARPLAYALREPVEKALDELVRDGIITPVSTSEWATPIVPVMKKDGTIRICGDFKVTLNKFLEVDRFPLPRVEDLLAKLHGGERFTKLDFSQAFAQLMLDDSKTLTVINTHKGLFMYNRLIYGLASSPAIFQRKLEELFNDMPRVGVFIDDVIITGKDDREHLETLNEVFERLKKFGLKIKKEKCTFFADSVQYLGFVISKEGVHTCPEKIEAISKIAAPKNVTELRSFLGLVMYYAKFVPNVSTILSPLYALLRKGVAFEWNDSCSHAFYNIKQLLISSKVLAHYSLELPLILTTDASSIGIGAVIAHIVPEMNSHEGNNHEKPIAYASRVLNKAEQSYSQIEKEALAIIFGIRKFHQYLFGRKFILRTDHKPLVSIFGDKSGIPVMAASRMQRWAVLLSGYDYDIEYIRGDKNAADALSRLPVGETKNSKIGKTYVNFVQKFLPITRNTIKENLIKDEVLRKVGLYLQAGWPPHCDDDNIKPYYTRRNELYLDSDCIIWGYRIVIPSSLRDLVLKELHVGHMGIVKMKSIARSYVWWPGIDSDIERTCKDCATCAAECAAPPRAPPQPWPYIPEPWTRLHVDFLGPFDGKSFLVLIDSTTKWIEAFIMQKTTAPAVIKVLRETFARFGLPQQVVSDNGPPFSSTEYIDFMASNGIKIMHSPVYHPSSNGAAEAAVKLCKRALKKSLRDGYDLETALQSYLMAYRNVEHSTTGLSPAIALQRRNLRTRLDILRNDSSLLVRVQEAQQRQVKYSGGTARDFNVGDTIWAREYGKGRKWLKGKVDERVGSRNYIIDRENGPPIKRHVDQIRKRPNYMYDILCPDIQNLPDIPSNSASQAPEIQGNLQETQTDSSVVEVQEQREQPQALPVNRPKRIRKPVIRYGFEFD